jgi:hypothetical protein
MNKRRLPSLKGLFLTLSCQSGRKLAGIAFTFVGATISASSSGQAAWAHQNGSLQSNGSISIKSLSGGSYAGTVNPAGAVAKVSQSAVTQPPTVIVQATASLPIKTAGSTCVSNTTGTAPNQTAGEGTAILADRTNLLTCQSGLWTRSAQNSPTPAVLYLIGVAGYSTAPCPTTWTLIDAQSVWSSGSNSNTVKTCLAPVDKSCVTMYLDATGGFSPNACPSSWTQADNQAFNVSDTTYNTRRSCFKCS